MAKELTLEEKVQRALDFQEISNLWSKHFYYYAARKHYEEFEKFWATKTKDVRWTIHGQIFEGAEAVKHYYCISDDQRQTAQLEKVAKFYPIEVNKENFGAGNLRYHYQTTPVIEVAKDGKTAKGLWYTPGIIGGVGDDGKPSAVWMWEKYAIDFIKEDGQWKIWHMRNYYDFTIGFGEKFQDQKWERVLSRATVQPFAKPTRMEPDTYESYNPTRVPKLDPVPPEPYDTWDDSMAY